MRKPREGIHQVYYDMENSLVQMNTLDVLYSTGDSYLLQSSRVVHG